LIRIDLRTSEGLSFDAKLRWRHALGDQGLCWFEVPDPAHERRWWGM